MSILAHTGSNTPSRRRWAQLLLWGVAPAIGLGFQVASEIAAQQLVGRAFDIEWLRTAVQMPSVWAAIVFELIGLVVWLVVLAEFSLSEAFSISALSYVLVIGTSWVVFHEPASWLQVIGGLTILAGIWAIATDVEPHTKADGAELRSANARGEET